MSFVEDFLDCANTRVEWQKLLERDGYGKKTKFATPVCDIPARLVRKSMRVRTPEGDEVISSSHIWLFAPHLVDAQDKIILADGSEPVIANTETFPDEEEDQFTKIFFL